MSNLKFYVLFVHFTNTSLKDKLIFVKKIENYFIKWGTEIFSKQKIYKMNNFSHLLIFVITTVKVTHS